MNLINDPIQATESKEEKIRKFGEVRDQIDNQKKALGILYEYGTTAMNFS